MLVGALDGIAGGPFCRISCSTASMRASIFAVSYCSMVRILMVLASSSMAAFASSMLSTFSHSALT